MTIQASITWIQIRIVRQALLNRDWNEKIKRRFGLYDRILPQMVVKTNQRSLAAP